MATRSRADDQYEREALAAPTKARLTAQRHLWCQVMACALTPKPRPVDKDKNLCQQSFHQAVCRRHELSAFPTLSGLSSDSDHEHEDEEGAESEDCNNSEDIVTNTSSDSSQGEEDTGMNSV